MFSFLKLLVSLLVILQVVLCLLVDKPCMFTFLHFQFAFLLCMHELPVVEAVRVGSWRQNSCAWPSSVGRAHAVNSWGWTRAIRGVGAIPSVCFFFFLACLLLL